MTESATTAPSMSRERVGFSLHRVSVIAVNTLTEAVDTMGRLQLGKKFTADENAKIVAFLKTLTGDQPNFTLPILPPDSDKTPRPTPFSK